ncbi:MAG: M18 family aminopeptidase [Deltaproteobacteria bacterium]|nr:M18 family aminopeptidase [Deltaproteobacteria bacterium]
MVDDLIAFLNASPTPFHAVAEVQRRLEAAGFSRLDEGAAWGVAARGRHFVERGGGSIVAFSLGAKPVADAGFHIVGAHTDSPGLRLKPRAARSREGFIALDVEVYGSPILASWADRDLGIAGRVVVDEGDGRLVSRLIRLDGALARIGNVAIHLNREVNETGLILNRHRHLSPIFAEWGADGDPRAAFEERLAGAAAVSRDAIVGADLSLFDAAPPARGGADGEFIFSARLDNLAMCHAGLTALLRLPSGDNRTAASATAVLALFDHEEVGSQSARGADSPMLVDILGRLAGAAHEAWPRAASQSLLVSADMAHGVHPNYADLHDGAHMPRLNAGPVIKTNSNLRYATDGESAGFFRALGRAAGVTTQEFVNRADLACGTTIGPISASRLGIRTVDVGNAMLSMHSVREMSGARDVAPMIDLMARFFATSDRAPL